MDYQEQLSIAINHLQAGRNSQARGILVQLVQRDPKAIGGWLWLAECFDDLDKKVYCLNKVLGIDPNHKDALKKMQNIQGSGVLHSGGRPIVEPAGESSRVDLSNTQLGFETSGTNPIKPKKDRPTIALEHKPVNGTAKQFEWYQLWLLVLIAPVEDTYRELLSDPEARPTRGYLWVYIAGVVGIVINVLALVFRAETILATLAASLPEFGEAQRLFGYVLIGLIVSSPVLALFAPLGVILSAAIYQMVAKLLIGEGTFSEMVYALCAIAAPMSILSAIFSFPVPIFPLFGFLVGLYGIFLNIVAVKTVNRLPWGQAILTVLAIPVLIGIASCCLIVFSMQSSVGGLTPPQIP